MKEADNVTSVKKFTDPSFNDNFLQGLNALRKDGKFFDVSIWVQDTSFPSHRVVLAAASNYFRSMFTGMMRESYLDNVTIFDVAPHIMESLIDFCYTGTIFIFEDNAVDLLKAADIFQFPSVREACCGFLASQLHPSNCLDIIDFAEDMVCPDLAKKALNYTVSNIVALADHEDFLNLSYTRLKQILSHRDLGINREESAYEILLSWLKTNVPERMADFCRLMSFIRLPFIRRIYLLTRIETNPIIRASPLCQSLIKETRTFHMCMLDKHDISSIRYQPRPSTGVAELLITVGGCDENCDEATAVESYNPVCGQWRSLEPFTGNLRGGYATTGLGNDIYVTGGSDGVNVYNRVWRYNSQVNEWSEVAPMLHAREYHGSVVLNSYIYVVGSEGCEQYDFLSDRWSTIASLPHSVNNCSVTTCLGKIYSIGCKFDTEEFIIQVYTPETDSWSILECDLPQMAYAPHIVALCGLLYFIREDSTEVLTFNPTRMEWVKTTAPMLQVHLGGSVTIFEGKIIVSGGYDESFGLSGVIEAYDRENNQWSIIGKMRHPIFWHGCTSIYRYVSSPSGESFCSDPNLHDFSAYSSLLEK
ncbi:kelch-like protein 21 [Clavelina lepadiformis]|uniref:kelch-like protein 21 n=1 Tax=Clavelina lepadiformis TaxID=159417 RepID=UPI0040411B28